MISLLFFFSLFFLLYGVSGFMSAFYKWKSYFMTTNTNSNLTSPSSREDEGGERGEEFMDLEL
jgi:hypothetical protein